MLIDLLKPILENPIFVKYGLLGLFLNSVFSSFIPIPVVITSTALLLDGEETSTVFLVMTVGAIGGGILSYFIGYDGKKFYKLLKKTHENKHFEKSSGWLNKHGWTIIFILNLIPVLTEVVTIIAGIKKYDFKKFVISMGIARSIHSLVAIYLGNIFLQYFNYFRF
ncbi:MAG: VTT domain-containing protein [Thaumarchaeota archaeon]|nr:VTT domain-containing protein [Nitrososphaerota archaeon]